jgi:hypothetical protein
MQTLASIKFLSLRYIGVAASTPSFVAIQMLERCSVIAGRHNSEVFYYHCSVTTLHAVRPLGSQLCKFHKVGVPGGADKFFGIKTKFIEIIVEILNVSGVVEPSSNEMLVLFIIFIE